MAAEEDKKALKEVLYHIELESMMAYHETLSEVSKESGIPLENLKLDEHPELKEEFSKRARPRILSVLDTGKEKLIQKARELGYKEDLIKSINEAMSELRYGIDQAFSK